MTKRSLSSSRRLSATRSQVRYVAAFAAMLFALPLSGCGSSPDPQLEARLSALEAKADAADKRSKQAISMASRQNTAPAQNFNEGTFGEPADPSPGMGNPPDDNSYGNGAEVPPPAPIAPGY